MHCNNQKTYSKMRTDANPCLPGWLEGTNPEWTLGVWGTSTRPSNVSAGTGDFAFPKGARLVPMPYGDGMDRLEACSCDAVSNPLLPSHSKKKKERKTKKSYRVNLHRHSKLDIRLSIFWKGKLNLTSFCFLAFLPHLHPHFLRLGSIFMFPLPPYFPSFLSSSRNPVFQMPLCTWGASMRRLANHCCGNYFSRQDQ